MKRRTKAQLEKELEALRRRFAELEGPQAGPGKADTSLPRERGSLQEHLDAVGVTVVCVDTEGRVALINRKGREVLGYEEEEILGENWFDLCCPPTIKTRATDVFRLLMAGATDSVEYYESPVLTKLGEQRTILWHNAVMKDAEGKVTGVLCSGEDITDRKRAEEALAESEALYRSLFENSLEGIGLSRGNRVIAANRALLEMFGYDDLDELVHVPLLELVAPECREMVRERVEKRARGEPVVPRYEYKIVRKDGEIRDIAISTAEVKLGDDIYVQSTFRDTTEHKRAAELLRIQRNLAMALAAGPGFEKGLRLCLEAALEGSGMDAGGIYVADEATGGFDLVCHIGLSLGFVESASHFDADSANVRLVMAGEPVYSQHLGLDVSLPEAERSENLRAMAIVPAHHKGRPVGCLNVTSHSADEVPGFARQALEAISAQIGAAIARLRAEEALRESEKKYRDLVEEVSDIIYSVDAEGRITYVGPTIRDLGYDPSEMVGQPFINYVHEEDRPRLSEKFKERLSGRTGLAEYRIATKSGDVRWIRGSSRPAYEGGLVVGLRGVATDVTEQRRAEEALRESEKKYRELVEEVNDIIYAVDSGGTISYISPSAEELSGFSPAELIGRPFARFIHEEDRPRVLQLFRERLAGHLEPAEYRVVTKSGEPRWVRTSSRPAFEGGVAVGLRGVMTDITERRRAEEALRAAMETAQRYLDIAGVMFVAIDAHETVTLVNRKACQVLGCEANEVLGRNWFDEFLPERLRETVRAVFQQLMKGEIEPVEYFENPVLSRSGEERIIAWHNTVLRDESDLIVGTLASGEDITERKRAEEALQESERRFRTLFENAPIGLGVAKANGALLAFNSAIARMTGYSHAEVERLNVRDLYQSPDDRERLLERLRKDGAVRGFEAALKRKDGTAYHASLTVVPFALSGEDVLLTVIEDITERKRLEREILDISASERRRIGEDLHDGLGQHLTGVALLAKALAGKLAAESSPASAEAAKIEALVNQTISWTRDLARAAHPVDPAPEGLMSALQAMASSEEELLGVSCVFCCDQTILIHDNSVATHLYRMAQEALSNAVRHGRAKHVEIGLARVEGGVRLEVTDDGLGIPEPLEEDKGMGLRIMAYRARMIGGALEIRRRPTGGTMVACTVRPRPGP